MPSSVNIDTRLKLERLKKSFTNGNGLVHLNNAGLAPSSRAAQREVVHWMERFCRDGMHCNDDYLAAVDHARVQLSRLLDCSDQEIAFFQSTAGAISQVAFGLSLRAGDEVLTWDQEYPSNLYPWKAACDRAGACLVLVPSGANFETDVQRLVEAITERTRVIAISWVQYQTGAVTDLAPLVAAARARGIWTVIDAIQGIGLLPFSFRESGLDAICGGSHKWMLSPVGVGYLAVREDRIRELTPLIIGAATYGTCDDPANFTCLPKTNAWKFEAGSKQVLEIVALGASAQVLTETGVDTIRDEAERLSRKLLARLEAQGYATHSPHGAAQVRGSIVSFSEGRDFRGNAAEPNANSTARIERALRENKISFALRGPGVRLSPHAFNQDQDIERALEALRR